MLHNPANAVYYYTFIHNSYIIRYTFAVLLQNVSQIAQDVYGYHTNVVIPCTIVFMTHIQISVFSIKTVVNM